MSIPRLTVALASASFVTALSTCALAGPSSDFGDRPSSPKVDQAADEVPAHRTNPRLASSAPVLPEPPGKVWHGYQILLADTALVALAYGTTGQMLYGLGASGPLIHLANGHPWRALGSLALRVGMAGGGMFIGLAVGRAEAGTDDEACRQPGNGLCSFDQAIVTIAYVLVGSAVGIAGASLIDAGALAWEDAPAARPAPTGLRVAPSFARVEGGGTLGIAGVF